MKPAGVKSDMCIEYDVYHNKKDLQFKVGGHVRISKPKNIFLRKPTLQIGQNKFSLPKKSKILCCRHMLVVVLKMGK